MAKKKDNVQESFDFDDEKTSKKNKKETVKETKKVTKKKEVEVKDDNRKGDFVIFGIIGLIIVLIVVALVLSSGAGKKEYLTGKYNVEISVKNYGDIELELDADKAPITVTNFVDLVKSGFYDGLTFHRIMDGFMIQGGDPDGNGTGGSGKTIKGEFEENNVHNDISHTRGTISMARESSDLNSASSQFFIVQDDSLFLDGHYAAFGHVTAGMEVVDEIVKKVKPIDDNGTVEAKNQPIIDYIIVVE